MLCVTLRCRVDQLAGQAVEVSHGGVSTVALNIGLLTWQGETRIR